MQQRRRVKHALTFEERLACQAERLRDDARKMPMGKQRDQVLKRARQAETALGITRWLMSPGYPKPPDLTPKTLTVPGAGGNDDGLSDFTGKLRRDAAEAATIRDLATDKAKREVSGRLHDHLNRRAYEVERAMAAKKVET